jgi:hypothetical protein
MRPAENVCTPILGEPKVEVDNLIIGNIVRRAADNRHQINTEITEMTTEDRATLATRQVPQSVHLSAPAPCGKLPELSHIEFELRCSSFGRREHPAD